MEPSQHTSQQAPDLFYAQAAVKQYEIDDATIAVRVFGHGPAIVFIHGYPVHGYTWRKLLPKLSLEYTCYVVDLPGFGDSDWTHETNFTFTAQAHRLNVLFKRLNLNNFTIMAHDTGATLARMLALHQPDNVKNLVIINTEIPNHRPPWIPFYQFCASLPLSAMVFRALLKSSLFIRSSMGLGQFYSDTSMFNVSTNVLPYINPLTQSSKKMHGMLSYLKGIEWPVVDELFNRHKEIKSNILFLWGEEDKTFPVALAEKMCSQFTCEYRFVRIANASLMPQEEQPDAILGSLIPFLRGAIAQVKV